ncbi:UNVERIFIED_CONTAM: hypothetical protein K2H54_006891, partial [Gekko kuhli]
CALDRLAAGPDILLGILSPNLPPLSPEMSGSEEELIPTTTAGSTPTTQSDVPVTMGAPGTILKTTILVFYTLLGPRYYDGVLYQQIGLYHGPHPSQALQWGHFHPDSTEETYVLTQGPRRDSCFDMRDPLPYPLPRVRPDRQWVTSHTQEQRGRHLEKGEDEDDDFGTWLEALERGQQRMQRNIEEVVLTIPNLVIRALRAEREAEQARGSQQQQQQASPPLPLHMLPVPGTPIPGEDRDPDRKAPQ